jgi:hypothetical protein
MSLATHNRVMVIGFVMAYCALMGVFVCLSFGSVGAMTIKFVWPLPA